MGEQIIKLCLSNSKNTWVRLSSFYSCAHLFNTRAAGRDAAEAAGDGVCVWMLLCEEAQVTSFLDEWPCMPRRLTVCLKRLESYCWNCHH